MLLGREAERGAIDAVLDAARSGQSAALILRGEPGIGSTTLLDYAADEASDLHVVRTACVESEREFAFAGLHQLCAPLMEHLDRLPAPQRSALEAVFGLGDDAAPDLFRVGLALLGLMSEVAREQPLLCIIDDAGWLDPASANVLALVGRRLGSEPIALLIATPPAGGQATFAGLDEAVVRGLAPEDAAELLRAAVHGPLDPRVRDRIVAETRGNPSALLELSCQLTDAELSGGFGAPSTLLSAQIEEGFLHRLRCLPADTRRLLLVAAADPLGEPRVVLQAARQLGVAVEERATNEWGGLLEFGSRVRFRHPLVRAAIYQAATTDERRLVHEALANATDPAADPDHQVWHRALATQQPDAEVADDLERSAERAADRGGLPAAAAFLERSAVLTPDPAARADRFVAAAEARHRAGAPDQAHELLAAADAGPMADLRRARIERLRARIAFTTRRAGDAAAPLLCCAQALQPLDQQLARETYLDALAAALEAGRLANGPDARAVAEVIRAAPAPTGTPTATDALLDGLVVRLTDGFAAGAPLMRQALALLREHPDEWFSGLPGRVALELWEFDAARRLLTGQVRAARAAGALTGLPMVTNILAALHVQAGEFGVAERVLEEADAVTATTGDVSTDSGRLHLSAWRGEVQTAELVESVVADAERRGEGRQLSHAEYAMAVLNNGLGRYRTALTMSQRALEHEELLGCWLLPELVEAAARSGEDEIASAALDRLAERTSLCPTDWSAGIEARCRALLAEGDAAQALYEQAIERLAAGGVATQVARARLLYGEWLRRERRQVEAREQLRAAYEMFDAMGADVFARRARRELLATGERARPRSAEASGELTARELQIATLAADGQTNPEIGRQLFISPRTVEYHLHKVFRKLSVSNRNQLAHALPEVAVIERRRSAHVPAIDSPLVSRVAAAVDGTRAR